MGYLERPKLPARGIFSRAAPSCAQEWSGQKRISVLPISSEPLHGGLIGISALPKMTLSLVRSPSYSDKLGAWSQDFICLVDS